MKCDHIQSSYFDYTFIEYNVLQINVLKKKNISDLVRQLDLT